MLMQMFDTTVETTLMEQVKQGNAQAFRMLVNRHLPKAHSIAMRVLHSHADAQEAVQDAFSKIWVNAYRFDANQASFTTWFYRILTNTCLDMARKAQPRHANVDDMQDTLPDTQATQEETLQAQEQNAYIRNAVQALPENQRIAVVLCYFEDISNQEAASIMNLNIKALEGLLVRARKTLKDKLDKPWITTNAYLKAN